MGNRRGQGERTLRSPRQRLLFVTGGGGFLGHHIGTGLASSGWEIVAPSSSNLDLRHRSSVIAAVGDWKPTAVIHTAYRRGDRASIVDASAHVAEAAAAVGARLVHISTDVVFAGRDTPYTEADEPRPVHEYGLDKAEAERLVVAHCPQALIIRTSLLLGRSVLSTHERMVLDAIDNRSPMTFYTDEVRCPALVDDVAAAVTNLAAERELAGVLHVAGPEAISRAELALMVARRQGWDASKLSIGPMGDARLMRPAHVVLDSGKARSLGIGVRGPTDW